jgi:hypothetical protein
MRKVGKGEAAGRGQEPTCSSSLHKGDVIPPSLTAGWRRFVHVTSIDFLTLTALVPFWMSNDAELRKWEPRDKLVPLLSVIPLLGPCIYLCLRPRAQW